MWTQVVSAVRLKMFESEHVGSIKGRQNISLRLCEILKCQSVQKSSDNTALCSSGIVLANHNFLLHGWLIPI